LYNTFTASGYADLGLKKYKLDSGYSGPKI